MLKRIVIVIVLAALSIQNVFSNELDIDGNSQADALTDGLLVVRYQFGLRGAALIDGSVSSNATRTTALSIETFLASKIHLYDVDGNGIVDALTDGLLIIRFLFGLSGTTLT